MKGLLGVLSRVMGIRQMKHRPLGHPEEAKANINGFKSLVPAIKSENRSTVCPVGLYHGIRNKGM